MNTEKNSFGQFLAECRIKKGYTQKELAEKLFIGESAVSKWEKDKRRPDLELVTRLSEIFGISESELIHASIDTERIREKQQAKKFRIINKTYNFVLIISFSIALLTCFIVNLAVSHTLSWFFVVLSSLILASIVLLLPQFVTKHRLLIISLSWLVGLYQLLAVVCVYSGGNWFFIPAFALLLSYSIIFTPLLIKAYLPDKFKRHNAVLSVLTDATLLLLMLVVVDLYVFLKGENSFGWSFSTGLPIELYWVVVVLSVVGILRYTKINRAFKTSVVVSIWLVAYNVFNYVFLSLWSLEQANGKFWQANFLNWSTAELISANVTLIVILATLAVAVGFLVAGILICNKKGKNKC